MASELIVQTIQGPSSGANANKVLIPSGHTLDVSGGTMLPSADQIIQTQVGYYTGDISTSSTSMVSSGISVSITPKQSTSKILISLCGGRPYVDFNNAQIDVKLYEGTSAADSLRMTSLYYNSTSGVHQAGVIGTSIVDATDTTSRTYNIYFRSAGAAGTVYLNNGSDFSMFLIAQEIAQ